MAEHEGDLGNNPYRKPKEHKIEVLPVEGDSDLFAYTHDYEVLEPKPFTGILHGVTKLPEQEPHGKP